MKYCSKCGSEINDEAVVCPKCGCETELGRQNRLPKSDSNGAKICGILSIFFGAFGGVLGILFGVICLAIDKEKKYKNLAIVGIGLSVIVIILAIYLSRTRITLH